MSALDQAMPWWGENGYRIEFFEETENGTDVRVGFTYSWMMPRVGERVHLFGKGGPASGTSYAVKAVGYQFVNGALIDTADDLRHPTMPDILFTNHVIVQVVKYNAVREVVRAIEFLRRRLEHLRAKETSDAQ